MDEELEKILSIKKAWTDKIMSLPNVNSVSIGQKESQYYIHVTVSQKLPISQLKHHEVIPDECDGVPTDVFEVKGISIHAM